jgi:hypothetical protein
MMQSGRTALASSGRISGSGLANARMMGWVPMALTMSAVSTPAAEQPRKTSAPATTSASVRAVVTWQ